MAIPLFAHDADERVDRPLCYKSRDKILSMLRTGSIEVLRDSKGKEWAAKFRPIVEHTLQSQLQFYLERSASPIPIPEVFEFLGDSEESTGAITDVECRANAGVVESRIDGLESAMILRARNKVAAWPHVRDANNISVSGLRWA